MRTIPPPLPFSGKSGRNHWHPVQDSPECFRDVDDSAFISEVENAIVSLLGIALDESVLEDGKPAFEDIVDDDMLELIKDELIHSEMLVRNGGSGEKAAILSPEAIEEARRNIGALLSDHLDGMAQGNAFRVMLHQHCPDLPDPEFDRLLNGVLADIKALFGSAER
jgi:hypothetical protein